DLPGGEEAWLLTSESGQYKLRYVGVPEAVVAYSYIVDENNNLVITDLLGNDDLFAFVTEDGNTLISGLFGDSTFHWIDENDEIHPMPASHEISALASITLNTGDGDDMIYFVHEQTFNNMPSLTLIGGAGINSLALTAPITFAENANLKIGQSALDPQFNYVAADRAFFHPD